MTRILYQLVKVSAYDFDRGDKTEFTDIITIAIPYDKNIPRKAQKANVLAQNTITSPQEWEGVNYELDPEKNFPLYNMAFTIKLTYRIILPKIGIVWYINTGYADFLA